MDGGAERTSAPGRTPLRRDPLLVVLTGGLVLSTFGDFALLVAQAIWVKSLTGSNSAAGIPILLVAAPALFAPLLGWAVDLVGRRAFLIAGNLASALVVLPLLTVHDRGRLWVIYVVSVGYGASMIALNAALNGLLKERFEDRRLADVNGVLQTGRQGLRLVAPLAGAGLYAAAGPRAVVLLDAATFVIAAVAFLLLPGRANGEAADDAPDHRATAREAAAGVRAPVAWRHQAVAGVRYVLGHPQLRQVGIGLGGALLVVGFTETAMFAVADQGLHRPPAFVGVLTSVQGVGAIAGGLGAARLVGRVGEVRAVGVGIGLFGLGVAVLGTGLLAVVAAGLAVAGAGLPVAVVGCATLTQRATPPRLMGRVSTALDLLIGVPQTVSIGLGALLIALVDYRVLLAAMTVTLLIIATRLVAAPARSS